MDITLKIVKAFLSIFLIGISFGLAIVFFWFCYAMSLNFYKIFWKKSNKKSCKHNALTYHDGLYDFWTCNDCKENFPN